jgi:SAM-dependent methyltransferase
MRVDKAVEQVRADYDAAPYDSHAFPQSAPGQLAAIAYLFGLDVPDVSTARVLEIGCAAGGNLIPFAAEHPMAHTVGVDLSDVQINQGRLRVQALGLPNVELITADIAQIDLSSLGQFDFIIAHGVYSWVPETVQEAVLLAIGTLLAPKGVAYLSYNVYPGWKAKEIVRDAMLMFASTKQTPDEKVRYARGMIDFLEAATPAEGLMARVLADYKAVESNRRDYYVLHEELETYNLPCYFFELVERAHPHGLGYLADAQPQLMFAENFGRAVAEKLAQECQNSQILLEQYLDFVVNRTFRQSLLVRSDRLSQISYQLKHNRFQKLHFAAVPVDPDATPVASDPVVKTTLAVLGARLPWTVPYPELTATVVSELRSSGIAKAEIRRRINHLLESLIRSGRVLYRLAPVAPAPSPTPWLLDEPPRRMAELTRDEEDASTFNPWHETLLLSPVDRHLLPLLDGTRDREELVSALLDVAEQNLISVERDGEPVRTAAELRDVLAEQVDELPQRLAGMKLVRDP